MHSTLKTGNVQLSVFRLRHIQMDRYTSTYFYFPGYWRYIWNYPHHILFRRKKIPCSLFGFFEIMIWLFLAIGQVDADLTNIYYLCRLCGGFAMGNFVGKYIRGKNGDRYPGYQDHHKKRCSDLIEPWIQKLWNYYCGCQRGYRGVWNSFTQ